MITKKVIFITNKQCQ